MSSTPDTTAVWHSACCSARRPVWHATSAALHAVSTETHGPCSPSANDSRPDAIDAALQSMVNRRVNVMQVVIFDEDFAYFMAKAYFLGLLGEGKLMIFADAARRRRGAGGRPADLLPRERPGAARDAARQG